MLTSGLPEGLVSFLRGVFGVRPDLRTWKAPWPACMLVWGVRGISGRAERALLLPAPLRGLSVSLQCALLSEGGSVPNVLQRVCEPAATERSCNRKAEVKQRVKNDEKRRCSRCLCFSCFIFCALDFFVVLSYSELCYRSRLCSGSLVNQSKFGRLKRHPLPPTRSQGLGNN